MACWGHNTYGQSTSPVGLASVTQVEAGGYHTCALKADATVVCWGINSYGQATVPVGLASVAQISAGELHTCAFKTDGSVVCWGNNDYEQSTVPDGLNLGSPNPPAPNDPHDTVDELRDAIAEMALPTKIESGLLGAFKKIDKAKNLAGACRQIDSFAAKVSAYLALGQLTTFQADELLEGATATKANMGCA